MSKKSIAKIVFGKCQKQEAERIKAEREKHEKLKEEFLCFMQEQFQKLLSEYKQWPTSGIEIERHRLMKFSEDLMQELGFKVIGNVETKTVSIPEHVKGEKRTIAQQMLHQFKIDSKQKCKADIQRAKETYAQVLEKLKQGEFTSRKLSNGSYRVNVTVTRSNMSDAFVKEAERLVNAKKGFTAFAIYGDCWTIDVSSL